MGEEKPFEGLAVQGYFLYIYVFVALVNYPYFEEITIFEADGCPVDGRTAHSILVGAGSYRVETQGAEDVPGAHLAAIIVPSQSIRGGPELLFQDHPHPLLRFPGLVCEVI